MKYQVLSLFLLAMALAVLSTPLVAGDKNTHEGTLVKSTSDKDFVMEVKGKEHNHTLAANAKVTDTDGKDCKLADLQKGQKIRVTTTEGDTKTATKSGSEG